MNEKHVGLMLDAGFNFVQGGSFTPEAMTRLKDAGVHRMMYICSRTIYHELLFPKWPQLKTATILTPDQQHKVIYNNPARYAGCYNQPAWFDYVTKLMDQWQETSPRPAWAARRGAHGQAQAAGDRDGPVAADGVRERAERAEAGRARGASGKLRLPI
ncbi:MAG: hypothetical protein FJ279_34645 [Planctomycetes bacterium]|nr:hypothetical protein [Planctomycetota bacterium]MBM4080849.1 hypothetical protein [Planctomycetota bacterium]